MLGLRKRLKAKEEPEDLESGRLQRRSIHNGSDSKQSKKIALILFGVVVLIVLFGLEYYAEWTRLAKLQTVEKGLELVPSRCRKYLSNPQDAPLAAVEENGILALLKLRWIEEVRQTNAPFKDLVL
jgi:hypothetical protein